MHAGAPGRQSGTSRPAPESTELLRTYALREFTVLELRGEIDLAALPRLQPHIDFATGGHGPQIVIDLRQVTFLDCSGLRLLCRARTRAEERGGRVRLICDHPLTLRILRAAGLMQAFRPVADMEAAVESE
ncbi:STAS domain-containing protein [Streptomyces sp. A7024]|uniref:Anti-sigma factor antagonist n=1 Tax=Streptomyces coryli TaxID=1128680 RepID=A0A6G4TY73_9ACTN|nr:STAS domain-containing protein [Streptomyces coryli]NGN64834.1 STAS domain-containing protein [Streptomyces coryli]